MFNTAADAFSIIAAIFAILVVRKISARQDEKAGRVAALQIPPDQSKAQGA